MSTALDTTLVPKVQSIINDYGKTITVEVPGLSEYDADSGSVIESGVVTYSVKGTPPENFTSRWIDGDLVKDGDTQVSIAASGLSFTPVNGQTVTIDTDHWKVVRVQTVYTGDDIALYTLQLRM
jgi:hypothetical protein